MRFKELVSEIDYKTKKVKVTFKDNDKNVISFIKKLNDSDYTLKHTYPTADACTWFVNMEYGLTQNDRSQIIKIKEIDDFLFWSQSYGIIPNFKMKPNGDKFDLYEVKKDVLKKHNMYY